MSDRLRELDGLLQGMEDNEVAKAWAHCMRALRVRDLVRTANTPVGDYAERICCDRFGLERKGFSEKSVDAVDAKGIRYQIKGRRLTPENRSRQLGAIRDVEKQLFDVLLAVFFNQTKNGGGEIRTLGTPIRRTTVFETANIWLYRAKN